MRNYEAVLIFKTSIEEEQRTELYQRFVDIIEENGSIKDVAEWGTRKLAYEIDYNTEGYYYIITFQAEPEVVENFERRARITEPVLRFMVTRTDA